MATSGSIPTPDATDTRINPIEIIAAHTISLRFDGSERYFALLRVVKSFMAIMTSHTQKCYS